jgi:hypothetical protein
MGTWFSRVGGAATASTANGGKITAVTLGTTSAAILAVNGARQSLMFHNPGAATVYVTAATTATGGPLNPSLSNLAGCLQIPSGATMIAPTECQCAWQGFAASAGAPLTIMESNI